MMMYRCDHVMSSYYHVMFSCDYAMSCCDDQCDRRPANLENVFRGTFRVKKWDLPAKSGTVGRAHIEIFLEVYSLEKSIAFQNTL